MKRKTVTLYTVAARSHCVSNCAAERLVKVHSVGIVQNVFKISSDLLSCFPSDTVDCARGQMRSRTAESK